MKRDTPYRIARAQWERDYLESALFAHAGDVPKAAVTTGIGRTQMYRLLDRHGIRVTVPRNSEQQEVA